MYKFCFLSKDLDEAPAEVLNTLASQVLQVDTAGILGPRLLWHFFDCRDPDDQCWE